MAGSGKAKGGSATEREPSTKAIPDRAEAWCGQIKPINKEKHLRVGAGTRIKKDPPS